MLLPFTTADVQLTRFRCPSAMEEQRRILQAQIAEAQERKEQEKKRLQEEDEMMERRVRAELANMGSDSHRSKALSKDIAEENHNTFTALQAQKAKQVRRAPALRFSSMSLRVSTIYAARVARK